MVIDGVRENREFTYIVVSGDGSDYGNSDGIGKYDVNVTVLQLLVRSFAVTLLCFFFAFTSLQ